MKTTTLFLTLSLILSSVNSVFASDIVSKCYDRRSGECQVRY